MKVSILGASGRIGRQLLTTLLYDPFPDDLQLHFFTARPELLRAFLLDASSVRQLGHVTIHDYAVEGSAIANSKLVLVLSGAVAKNSTKLEFEEADPTGRYAQSFENLDIIDLVATKCLEYCPGAAVVIFTNQSDHMAIHARQILKGNADVFGFGGMLDTLRFRRFGGGRGDMVLGAHSQDMFVKATIETKTCVRDALNRTANFGKVLSDKYRPFRMKQEQVGSFLAPAFCADAIIRAFGSENTLCYPFNVKAELASNSNVEASLPVCISHGRMVLKPDLNLTTVELAAVENISRKLRHEYDHIIAQKALSRHVGIER